jgi:hypothetical protein
VVAKDVNIVMVDGKRMYESSDEQMSSTPSYSTQRKERLDDAIFDYLSDESVNAQQTYDDLINSIKSDAAYYKRYYEKCRDLLFKMGYYGSVDDDVKVVGGVAYSAAADAYGASAKGILKFERPNVPDRY